MNFLKKGKIMKTILYTLYFMEIICSKKGKMK